MIYLILAIVVSIGIFLVFRFAGIYKLSPLPIVFVNYLIAILAALSTTRINQSVSESLSPGFYIASVIIGVLFMLLFLVVHQSTNSAGISITSAAAKLSVVFPVLLSFYIDSNDRLYPKKIIGIVILLVAFVLIVYSNGIQLKKKSLPVFPLLLFLGMGFVDSLIKLSQQIFIPEEAVSLFTLYVFSVAAITGFIFLLLKKKAHLLLNGRTILLGIVLGICNYGSLYFIIKALNLNLHKPTFLDSSRIFMLTNLGVVLLSTLVGIILFRERLQRANYIGILLSIMGFYLIM